MPDYDDAYGAWHQLHAVIRPIPKLFVVGCAKSGTTWLERLLNGHPEVVVRGEGRFFHDMFPMIQTAVASFNQSGGNPERITAFRDADLQHLMRWIIDGQFVRYALDSGRPLERIRVLGDKTPGHTQSIRPLAGLFPAAKFIHIVRDPRDATNSQWHFWAREHDPRSLDEFTQYSIEQVWPLNVRQAREDGQPLGADRYIEVRYEDLVADEARELRRLFRFLGVTDGDDAIEGSRQAGAFERSSGGRARGDEARGHLFRKGVIGDWVHHLPADVVHASCTVIADLMRDFGYDPGLPDTAIEPTPDAASRATTMP